MRQEIDTIIFDLDGTIYQNTEFHRDYLRFLVDGTGLEAWADSLIAFADAVFVGERLVMNAFYDARPIEASTPAAYFAALERALLPELTYEEALARADCLYTGDAWAVVTLMGQTLGLLDGERSDAVYPAHPRQDECRRHDPAVRGSDAPSRGWRAVAKPYC